MTDLARMIWDARSGGWWIRLHDLDRPTTLSRQEPYPSVDHMQEVTSKAAAGWTVGRHGLRDKKPRASRRDLRQRIEDPSQEQGGFFRRHILIKERGQWVQQDHQPDGMKREHGGQPVTEQRGELPAGEGADNMRPPQEDVRRDAAGFRHRDQGAEPERHVGINDRRMAPVRKHTCGGVECHAMHTRIAPEEERARLRRHGRCWTHG
jgi:hypothetical protein